MPKMVSELSQGQNYEFSADQNQATVSSARVFRILLTDPGEFVDIPVACSAFIGQEHPRNPGVFCYSYSGVYEGESRMVILATFNYRTTPSADGSGSGSGQDPQSQPPDVRPANWYTNTSLMEVPAYLWTKVSGVNGSLSGDAVPIHNPAGDLYEGVTAVQPITTITIEQFQPVDPTTLNQYAGYTNSVPLTLGSLNMGRRTVMFRGVQSRPQNDTWQGQFFRGWNCSYEFLYKRNSAYAMAGGVYLLQDVGWDVLQVQSGFSVKAFNPPGNADQDVFGQPLKHTDDNQIAEPFALPGGVAAGKKVRAMIRIASGDKHSQRPSAQPIALNDDGTPRIETANPKVLVYRYKVTEEVDFTQWPIRTGI
jgi:hypothetical protein